MSRTRARADLRTLRSIGGYYLWHVATLACLVVAFDGKAPKTLLAMSMSVPEYLVSVQEADISNGSRLAIAISSDQVGANPMAGGSQNPLMVSMRHSF